MGLDTEVVGIVVVVESRGKVIFGVLNISLLMCHTSAKLNHVLN